MDELGSDDRLQPLSHRLAHAMNTPFQWTKQVASQFRRQPATGWSSSWPARIKDKVGIRTQFHHVIDIAPTISKP